MDKYMNLPMEEKLTAELIKAEFEIYKDKRVVARRNCLKVSEVTKILKELENEKNGLYNGKS